MTCFVFRSFQPTPLSPLPTQAHPRPRPALKRPRTGRQPMAHHTPGRRPTARRSGLSMGVAAFRCPRRPPCLHPRPAHRPSMAEVVARSCSAHRSPCRRRRGQRLAGARCRHPARCSRRPAPTRHRSQHPPPGMAGRWERRAAWPRPRLRAGRRRHRHPPPRRAPCRRPPPSAPPPPPHPPSWPPANASTPPKSRAPLPRPRWWAGSRPPSPRGVAARTRCRPPRARAMRCETRGTPPLAPCAPPCTVCRPLQTGWRARGRR